MADPQPQQPGSASFIVTILIVLSSIGYSCDTRKKLDDRAKVDEARDKQVAEIQSKIIELAAQRK